jgi:hypothetical protein
MPWLHDEFVETYLAWRDASADVRAAYDCWRTVGRPDTPLAFWAYHAALDREERAARAYAGSAARLARLVAVTARPSPRRPASPAGAHPPPARPARSR